MRGSEYGEDVWIMENLNLPPVGFFVDIGCNDPNQYNNTAFLRDRGWKGLAIDAAETFRAEWEREGVPFVHAILSDAVREVMFCGGGPCAHITEGKGQLSKTLDQVLEAVKQIDFLSIDIEGEEYNAMTTFDFNRFKPSVIVGEYSTMKDGGSVVEDLRLKELLSKYGYREVHRTTANIIYANE